MLSTLDHSTPRGLLRVSKMKAAACRVPRARGRAGSKDEETGEQEYHRGRRKARAPEEAQAKSMGTRGGSKGVRVQVGSGDRKGKGNSGDPEDRGLLTRPFCPPCPIEALTAPGTALTLAFEIFPQ